LGHLWTIGISSLTYRAGSLAASREETRRSHPDEIATLTLIQYRRGAASAMKSINHRRRLAREALAAELDRRRRRQGVIENAATVKLE
jgi:hypothetical protein